MQSVATDLSTEISRFERHERSRETRMVLAKRLEEVATRRASWSPWVEELSAAFGEAAVLLAFGATATARPGAVLTVGIAPEFRRTYAQRYYAGDPWRQRLGTISSRIVFGYEVLPRPLLLRSEFYTDWMAPQGFHDVPTINGVIRAHSGAGAALAIFRARKTPMLQIEDLILLRELLPELQRALTRHAHPPRHGQSLDQVRRCA